ncbi:Ubiquinone biosynthesis protein COQ9,mitochondrial [Wickerhamomyces ciferrii]|uniref:Ubiquinone biosynthesis protein n=1 Tax=Wickerhamomyces ciferrii (strain ATCC 14091 / BCRC 22168 / CBS 111 / JCM 3599 / NBRC 0793 / NRRL Y-1031 F-60-10) TaxID=1206466 RepID=K0K8Z9_WICCF|nr:Ubiquinone biosynthesis protein COQ9,mitochondrial [Wickerhamomyces ciferrii]CCH41335.1 Ubiquinone biosynthesis protein COQ9,mitochondrial [Wickerhamomyces ciferrii]
MFKQLRVIPRSFSPLRSSITRSYHSEDHKPFQFTTPQTKILDEALNLVPIYGFQHKAILEASRSQGYSDAIQSLFSNGTYDLIHHHLVKQRELLQTFITTDEFTSLKSENDKVKFLLKKRIMANQPYLKHLNQLQSYLVLPPYFQYSSNELHNLSDDILHYSGDFSNDFAWYSKRLSLSSTYVALELFQSQDKSNNSTKTLELIDKRLNGINELGNFYNDAEEFLKFSINSSINLFKSQASRG